MRKVPYWSKVATNNEGLVTIYFSESFIIPSNISSIDNTVLDLKIIPYDTTNLDFLKFTWNVNDYTNSYFVI